MSIEKADQWTEGQRQIVIMQIILPETIAADDMAGLIHRALIEKYPKLQPMEYHAFKLGAYHLR